MCTVSFFSKLSPTVQGKLCNYLRDKKSSTPGLARAAATNSVLDQVQLVSEVPKFHRFCLGQTVDKILRKSWQTKFARKEQQSSKTINSLLFLPYKRV